VFLIAILILIFISNLGYGLDLDLIFVVSGDSTTENLWYGVQSHGDLDGDGYSEVFVSSPGIQQVKVFKGGIIADTFPDKIYYYSRGNARAWLDDISGDGEDDFVILKREAGESGQYDIYYSDPDFYLKTEPDLSIYGDVEEGFGNGVYSEDADNDDQNELIVPLAYTCTPIDGKFYIYDMNSEPDSLPDDSLIIMRGDKDRFTISACVGDINGDGFADYAISPYLNSTPSYIIIYYGGTELDTVPDHHIGSPFNDSGGVGHFGYSIVPVRDLNNDGFDDFIVTCSGFSPCIFYGGDPFDTIPKILEYPGEVANVCGDINHDGWQDIAIGFRSFDYGSGLVYVYYGSHDMDTIADIFLPYFALPVVAHDFGKSVGPAGDFNGDGVDDLAVGSDASINPNYNPGKLFIFAGSDSLPTPAEDESDNPLPEKYNILKQNYPNPFNNGTVIEYDLWGISDRYINLSIYNILGQKVRILIDGIKPGGKHRIFWDGRNDNDLDVSSGLYFYRLKTNTEILSKKMIYLK
jgi:hypothetical protein